MIEETGKESSMNVEIAQRLANRRKRAGLSQEALAARLGVSRQAVSKWERSESSPDTDNLIALAQLYGVSLDELLYVDGEAEGDAAFEAAERATGQVPSSSVLSVDAAASAAADACPSGSDASEGSEEDADGSGKGSSKVRVGLGGIHVLDGDDYVHVSWRDGVHVRDSGKGDEVHVDWSGVHVKEAPRDGVPSSGGEVAVSRDGVTIDGEHFDDWRDARDRYGCGRASDGGWGEPCGYTVRGERFDTLEEARAVYGSEVGRSIPVRKHYLNSFERSWARFPYPAVAIIAYLLLGIFGDAWGLGLLLFFTVPLYYLVGRSIGRRRLALLVSGTYPLGVTAWFCYEAFVLNEPHPAWMAFLTIPLVEWLVHGLSRWWRGRAVAKVAAKGVSLDAEASAKR